MDSGPPTPEPQPVLPKVAIIGSGVSGLAALWALTHDPSKRTHEVHLFEAADYLGGHTHTVNYKHGSEVIAVDTGFIVLNAATYPNFISFLSHLRIPTIPTQMTFSVTRDQGAFEWSGSSLSSLFAQRANLFRPSMWRMLFDIIRFNTFALDLLSSEDSEEETLGAYLDREGYSDAFRNDYLIPMTAAVWSTSPDKCVLEFPAVTLVRFMWNHNLLNIVSSRPQWLTVKGGAKNYVEAVTRAVPAHQVHMCMPVTAVRGSGSVGEDGRETVLVSAKRGSVEFEYEYDHVIVATHGDQALRLLGDGATESEREILREFRTSTNTAVLHGDRKLLPVRKSAWAAWNYITASTPTSANVAQVSLTYNMNILQYIPPQRFGDVLVTLNPLSPPDPATVQGVYEYEHPLYTPEAVAAQRRLPEIQGKRGITFAGAWTGYGFHEDGFTSGLRAAVGSLGAEVPFEVRDARCVKGVRPQGRGLVERVMRALVGVVYLVVVVLEALLGKGAVRREPVGRRKKEL
ncbi:uncharacterized protein H6S33_000233 [Morchella sextelata]|uniref:uncharacterized protein n=1 Tax=Morchella sextelata TaxID=1174677 RepID=UPI001D0580AC|nr:uncharacterized protein H6S33_000233 [Morchella sextelata]KAH0614597.1 hypothetical protein H6S33_000233 [Morchella sextelata]